MPRTRSECPEEHAGPTELGPVLRLGATEVRAGTCSWTDPTLVRETSWYPKKSMSAADRLGYYAKHFPLVEVDSTYYRPPGEALTQSWAQRTPEGFIFNIKAYGLFTHHPVQPDTLWPDIKDGVRAEFEGKRHVYIDHLEPDALAEAWLRFDHALRPLHESQRLGAVLLQYPRWFTPKRANRDELAGLPERLPGTVLAIEFRSPGWLADDERDRTLALLRHHGLSSVVVDAPAVSGLDTVVTATSDDLAVVRFHGRADDTWTKRDISAAERFKYLYNDAELAAWVPRVRQLADQTARVHLLMNNCYQDYGVRNAEDLSRLLEDSGARRE